MKTAIGYSVLDIEGRSRQYPIPNTRYPIPARSISQTFPHSHAPTFRILSLHRRVCNLLSERGDVAALVHPTVGNGPFHIVLARAVSFAGLKVGGRVQWRDDRLLFGRFTVDLAGALAWDPTLPGMDASITACAWNALRAADLSGLADLTGLEAAVAGRIGQAAERLLAGLRTGRESDIVWATEQLAGLGPGLTPAGDDFLLGFMARIWLEPALLPPGWTAPDLCQRIVRIAGPRTTRLSRAWLLHAARGHFAEPWHDLATALTTNDQSAIPRAANRIFNTGATSGRDAMAGFLIVNGE